VTVPAPTINLAQPHGIWRPIYARREALHTTADALVIAAWKADLDGLTLAPAIAAWRQAVGETISPAQQQRRAAAAAAVLALLAARTWARTRAAIAEATRRAHRSGWAAGYALTSRDSDDDTDYEDSEPGSDYSIAGAELGDHTIASTTSSVLAAILTTTARRTGRAVADSTDDPETDAETVLTTGYDTRLTSDTAVSAAYGAGLLSAYLATEQTSISLITAGDSHVCATCADAEASSPYALLDAPRLPLHANCRCVLAPS
jgi:hypothetical protein